MKETGKMTNNMVLAKKFGTMEQRPTKGSSLKARKTERESSHGVMALTMRVTLLMDSLKVSALIISRRATRLTLVNSMMERLTEKER